MSIVVTEASEPAGACRCSRVTQRRRLITENRPARRAFCCSCKPSVTASCGQSCIPPARRHCGTKTCTDRPAGSLTDTRTAPLSHIQRSMHITHTHTDRQTERWGREREDACCTMGGGPAAMRGDQLPNFYHTVLTFERAV